MVRKLMKNNFRSPCLVLVMHQGLGDCIMSMPAYINIKENIDIVLVVKSKLEEQVFRLHPKKITNVYYVGAKSRWMRFLKMILASIMIRIKLRNKILIAPILSGRFLNYLFLVIAGGESYVPNESLIGSVSIAKIPQYDRQKLHYVDYIKSFFYCANLIDDRKEAESSIFNFHKNILPGLGFKNKKSGFLSIAIGPGCGIEEFNKIPSAEWFVGLVRSISVAYPNFKLLLYGGSSDKQKLELIRSALPSNSTKILLNMPIKDLLVELRSYDVIIAGTTGPGHLASLTGKPLVILSEMTNPTESGPYSPFVNNVRASLACSPCYRRGFPNGCEQINCTNLLSYQSVIAAIDNALKGVFIELTPLKTKVSTKPFDNSKFLIE
jgi:ADP-heptose:LPS heptosyltransferase